MAERSGAERSGAERWGARALALLRGPLRPALLLLLLGAGCALLSPRFLTWANLANVLVQGAIMAVVAMGMTPVIVAGAFDLSVGSTVALAGCVAAAVMAAAGTAAGVLAGVAAGAAVGLLNGGVVALLGVNAFIATLGTMVLVRGVAFLLTGGAPVSGGEDGLPEAFLAYGMARPLGVSALVWTAAAVLAGLGWVLHRTRYGRRLFAVGGGREAAYLSGLAVRRLGLSAFVWCGALAGLAGVMLAARLQSGQPQAGEFYELTAIAAVVLGGAALAGGEALLGNSVVGVFIMVVLGNGLNLMGVDSYWQRVVTGGVIIAAAAADRSRGR